MPREKLMPVIFVLCTIGSFAIASRTFAIWVMLGFGLLGYVLRRMSYPMAPLVLGIVLGEIRDKSFRRGMVLSDGDLTPFFTRPISAVLFAISAWRGESATTGAEHIGRGILERDVERAIADKDEEIVLYCGGGFRSALSARSRIHRR